MLAEAMTAQLMVALLCVADLPAFTANGLRGSQDMHCLSDMTPCRAGQSCCGSCVKAKFGGADTGLCANGGSWNYSASECRAADLPCSKDAPCCGVCNPVTGKCALQDTWSRTCISSGEACSSALKCCGSCVYQGADTAVCCQKVVHQDVYPFCCDHPEENPQLCQENETHAPPCQLAVAQGGSGALVPLHPKDLTGCGGHQYLHGDWTSEQLVHITTNSQSEERHCTLGGNGNSYMFGWPHERDDIVFGDRVFPICHRVDKANRCESQYQKCHVLINGGSDCTAEEVVTKLNRVKWVRDH